MWATRRFPEAWSHTPRRTRFPCACAPGTRTSDPPYRVTAAVAPLPFSRLRGVARALEVSASQFAVASIPDAHCPSMGFVPLRGHPSRPPPPIRCRLHSRLCLWGTSHRSRGVCPVEASPFRCRKRTSLGFSTSKIARLSAPFGASVGAPLGRTGFVRMTLSPCARRVPSSRGPIWIRPDQGSSP